jgi:hypothetical protein
MFFRALINFFLCRTPASHQDAGALGKKSFNAPIAAYFGGLLENQNEK